MSAMPGMNEALSATGRPPRGQAQQHDHVRRRYRGFARTYDRSFRRYTAWSRAIVLDAIAEVEGPRRILDACCGTGVVTAALLDRYPSTEIVGVDLSKEMLAKARARLDALGAGAASVRLVDSPAERIPIESESVDLLVCANAFHLIDRQEAAIGEFSRVLVPGGRLVILDWTCESVPMRYLVRWLHLTQKARRRLHSRESLSRLLAGAGLEVAWTRRERIPPAWGLMTVVARRTAAAKTQAFSATRATQSAI